MITYKTTRIQATTADEKSTVKSWSYHWKRFGQLERSGKPILFIFGDWSGYRSSQYQITHINYLGHSKAPIDFRGTVRFTDGTTMSVWIRAVTREEILSKNLRRKENYNELIGKLLASGKTFYDVGAEIKKEVPAF